MAHMGGGVICNVPIGKTGFSGFSQIKINRIFTNRIIMNALIYISESEGSIYQQ